MREVRVVRADPAGNITLFVLTPTPPAERPQVAESLMALDPSIEQVGFACEAEPGIDGRMEMAGGEFCGNASRAYGALLAKRAGLTGRVCLTLRVSGIDHPIMVDVDVENGRAAAQMPLPRGVTPMIVAGHRGVLVDFGGITHFAVENKRPDESMMQALEAILSCGELPDAYGVCGYDTKTYRMTPLVKVPTAGTLVFEGSCGSGTLACAIAMSEGVERRFTVELQQPAGTLEAFIERRNGAVVQTAIGGTVVLEEEKTVMIE